MKKAVIIFLMLFLFCIAGFSQDFTGSWITESEDSYGRMIDEIFTFYEDGTGEYSMNQGSSYSAFTYTYTASTISIAWEINGHVTEYTYILYRDDTLGLGFSIDEELIYRRLE